MARLLPVLRSVAVVVLAATATGGGLVRLDLPTWSAIGATAAITVAAASDQLIRRLERSNAITEEPATIPPSRPTTTDPVDLTDFLEPAPVQRPQCPACGGHDLEHRAEQSHTEQHRCRRCDTQWRWRNGTPRPRTTTRPKVSKNHV